LTPRGASGSIDWTLVSRGSEERAVNVRGVLLKARVQWVLKNKGEEGLARVRAILPAETAEAMIGRELVSASWYPLQHLVELNVAIDKVHGKGDFALIEELGAYACESNIPTIYRLFFAVGTITYIIKKATAAWRVSYDEGNLELLVTEDHLVRFRMVGDFPRHRAHCLGLKGWIGKAAELSGARELEVKESCRCFGDPECEFEYRWR
jgi:hypothetical protein